ncbi:hypothetical protein BC826DRAFT_1031448 [Russula brevipes]|nr:hypothetical protein BC826DRAFT_1031448 [Russula brevipes]
MIMSGLTRSISAAIKHASHVSILRPSIRPERRSVTRNHAILLTRGQRHAHMITTEAGRLAGQLGVHDTWFAVLVANWIFPCAQVPVGYDRQLLTSTEAKGPNECCPSPTKGGDELAKILYADLGSWRNKVAARYGRNGAGSRLTFAPCHVKMMLLEGLRR